MLKRNLIANYLGQGWVALMGLAFVPLYIHFLGIEAYGLIGLFAVLQALLAVFDLGMAPTLNREMGRFTGGSQTAASIRDLLRSVEWVASLVACAIAAGIFFSAGWLAEVWLKAEHLSSARVAQALSIMGLIIALQFLSGIYSSSLVGLQQQVRLNQISAFMATLRGLGAVAVLAWYSPSIEAFFGWQIIVTILSLSMLRIATYGYLPEVGRAARFSFDALKGIGRYAGGMAGITILALMLTQSDKILLSRLLPLSEYGYYTLAALVAMGLRILIAPIVLAWFPRMSQLHAENDIKTFIDAYHEGAQLLCVTMGTATIILVLFAETLLQVWTQDADLVRACSTLVKWLALGNLLNGFMTIPYYAQLAHGWTGLALRINAVSVVIIIPAILFAVPRFGALGAAYIWVCLNTGYLLIGIHFMYRRILKTEKWRWYWLDIVRPMAFGGLMAALISLVPYQGFSIINQALLLGIATVLVACAMIFGAPRMRDRGRAFFLLAANKNV